MKISAKIFISVILVLFSIPTLALRVLPLVSYSPNSGVMFGGVVSHNMKSPYNPFAFNCMTQVFTNGSIFLKPVFLFPLQNGIINIEAAYRVDNEASFYGWGNDGDKDINTSYDRQMQCISGIYRFSPAAGFALSTGIRVNHSTVYDRAEDTLWTSSPCSDYGSLWSAGPLIEAHWLFPSLISGYALVEMEHQMGSGFSYSNASAALAFFTPIGASTTPAFRILGEKHFGTSETPFPYLPSLGRKIGLRGYHDRRFGGSWTLLANLELRQRLLSFKIDESNTIEIGVVLFGDAGQTTDDLDEVQWNRFHLDGGLGLRITIPGGGTFRFDFAVSPEGPCMQLAFGELF